jgi:hypothetical protein
MTIDPQTGKIDWIPRNDHVGANNVVVAVSDQSGENDTQSFTITVSNTNDAPTIISTQITAATEDMPYNYDVNATDVDIGDFLTYSLTTFPTAMVIDGITGMISWTPTNSQVGTNFVTVKVSDISGDVDLQSFNIIVVNVNDAPQINSAAVISATQDAPYAYDVDATDDDSGDILTYTLTESPLGMTINSSSGKISWIPSYSQVGDNPVVALVYDEGGETDSQSFTITVANVNDPPVFTSQPVIVATEEMEYFYEVEANDVDGDTLQYSVLNPPQGMVVDINVGTINWTPTNDQAGEHSIIVKVIDGLGGEKTQSFTITVENVNDGPVITSTPILVGTEDKEYTHQVEAQDEDLTGDTLVFDLSEYPDGMQINSSTGVISWIPTNSQIGENNMVVVVTDGNGGMDTQLFSITVENVNDAPIITSKAIDEATEDEPYNYNVNAIDHDPDDSLTYGLVSAPEGMIINALTGIINWTPQDANVGINQIVVQVTDNHSANTTQSFTITVVNVNDAPWISEVKVEPEIGTNRDRYVFTLKYNDPDGDEGTVKLFVNGVDYDMDKVGGDPEVGEVFSRQLSLSARNHTYYFTIDDDENPVEVSDIFTIIVTAADVPDDKEEELLPIPLWWIILILVIVILVILLYARSVKKKLRKQQLRPPMRTQQFQRQQRPPQRPTPRPYKEQKSQPPKEEESDEPLLSFIK